MRKEEQLSSVYSEIMKKKLLEEKKDNSNGVEF